MSRVGNARRPIRKEHDRATGIHEFRYANGLALLVGVRRTTPIVCSMIWYRTGSAREQKGATGISHFLEHLMFKGSRRFAKGEIDRVTQGLGGRNNAFTSRDYTAYYFLLAADRWQTALAIEADRMTGCLLDPEELESERKVVLEELRRELDSPWGALEQELMAAAYRYHPYRHPILGWQEDLEALTPGAVREHYRRHYHPANAVQVVCGDVDPDLAARAVGEAYGRIPAGPPPAPPPRTEPPQAGERRVVVESDVHVPRLQVLFHTPPVSSPDFHALEVAETILADGRSSRLYQRLVEQERLMRAVTAHNDAKRESGLFWLLGDLNPGAPVAKAERALYSELERLGRGRILRAEMEKAKNQISALFLFHMERTMEWAEMVGRFAVISDFRDLGGYLAKIEAVTAEDVRRVATKYFVRRNRTVGLALPWNHRDEGGNGRP